jgi:hypothetical protein
MTSSRTCEMYNWLHTQEVKIQIVHIKKLSSHGSKNDWRLNEENNYYFCKRNNKLIRFFLE